VAVAPRDSENNFSFTSSDIFDTYLSDGVSVASADGDSLMRCKGMSSPTATLDHGKLEVGDDVSQEVFVDCIDDGKRAPVCGCRSRPSRAAEEEIDVGEYLGAPLALTVTRATGGHDDPGQALRAVPGFAPAT
jgi:hypothetical protein